MGPLHWHANFTSPPLCPFLVPCAPYSQECFRQRNVASRLAGSDASVHVPYRESMLSRLMKRVLEPTSRRAGGGAGGSGSGSMCGSGGECHQPRVVVIATISPCASGG